MKRILSILIITLALTVAGRAQSNTTYYFSGAWWESRTTPGLVLAAGEIRVTLFDDGTCEAERDDNNQVFDFCVGTWSETRNRAGLVTAVKVTFTSDYAGEIFVATAKKGLLKGKFNGGGYKGNISARSLDPNPTPATPSAVADREIWKQNTTNSLRVRELIVCR